MYLHILSHKNEIKSSFYRSYLLGQTGGKESSLHEILEKHSLPVEVTPSDSHQLMNIQGQDRETGKSCHLNLVHSYEDRYLLGNAVSDGKYFTWNGHLETLVTSLLHLDIITQHSQFITL